MVAEVDRGRWQEKLGLHQDGHGAAACPRFVLGAIITVYLSLGCVWVERVWRLSALGFVDKVANRDHLVPNYHHINSERDPFYYKFGRGEMNNFGHDFIKVGGDWAKLCLLDSDGDSFTNGEELGDPCCRWQSRAPHTAFDLASNLEYRRWFVTSPGDINATWINAGGSFPSPNCSSDAYSPENYQAQYDHFYFHAVRDFAWGPPPEAKHFFGVAVTVILFGHWVKNQGLLEDVLPFLFGKPGLKIHTYFVVNLLAFIYMDLTSGVTHLCLDYMPKWIPVAGIVANGFQEHHRNPALLARKRLWNQINDVFIIMPLIVTFLIGTNPTRVARLFWFWSILYAILFLCAHPWAHMHRDMVPWLVGVAQDWGVLLDSERHMRHHADLESQFTILSGHADIVIDSLSHLVPPQRYDLWLFFLVTWLLVPVVLDLYWRTTVNRLSLSSAGKMTCKKAKVDAV